MPWPTLLVLWWYTIPLARSLACVPVQSGFHSNLDRSVAMDALLASSALSENQGLIANCKPKGLGGIFKNGDAGNRKVIGKQGGLQARRPLGDMSNQQRVLQPATAGVKPENPAPPQLPSVERMFLADPSIPPSLDSTGTDLQRVVHVMSSLRGATFNAPYESESERGMHTSSFVSFEPPLSPLSKAPPPSPASLLYSAWQVPRHAARPPSLAEVAEGACGSPSMSSPAARFRSFLQRPESPPPFLEMGPMEPVERESLDAAIASLALGTSVTESDTAGAECAPAATDASTVSSEAGTEERESGSQYTDPTWAACNFEGRESDMDMDLD